MNYERKRLKLFLSLIVIASIVAGVFSYEPVWQKINGSRPWSLGLDLAGGTLLTYEIDLSQVKDADKDAVTRGLRDVIEKRVNLFGVSEPKVYGEKVGNSSRLVVELAGIKDVDQAVKMIGETPFLEFREVQEEKLSTGSSTVSFVPTTLNGRFVTRAGLGRDQQTNVIEIDFSLNDEGAAMFEQITGKNIGKPICLFLDGQPIIPDDINDSCPRVQAKISGGNARITGQFSLDRAKQIVDRFNAGALPAPVKLINQQTIGSDFGQDSLQKAIFAGAIGTLIVMLFMMGYYRKLGVFAAIALVFYIALTLGVFKLLGVTMTLSGIAGFILSIGMAVDANILVFERTREEFKKGLSHQVAINEGFHRAWTSIRDSNVSTMITSGVLYFFTSGFVQGFALTLFVGVVISMFSAITTTRIMLKVFVK
ncbi:MAG: protein translocase subunit SecD [Candidatus Paceibacterota bacterium]|jgi:protein-export membrane protein SecD